MDLRHVRDNVASVQSNLEARGCGAFADAHRVKSLYEESLKMEFDVAQVRKERNRIGKRFAQAKSKEEKESVTGADAEGEGRGVGESGKRSGHPTIVCIAG